MYIVLMFEEKCKISQRNERFLLLTSSSSSSTVLKRLSRLSLLPALTAYCSAFRCSYSTRSSAYTKKTGTIAVTAIHMYFAHRKNVAFRKVFYKDDTILFPLR